MKDVPAARSAASIKTPDRLKNDAKLVIPVGSSDQKLNVITKISDNEIEEHEYDDVAFVPMLAGKSDDGNDV